MKPGFAIRRETESRLHKYRTWNVQRDIVCAGPTEYHSRLVLIRCTLGNESQKMSSFPVLQLSRQVTNHCGCVLLSDGVIVCMKQIKEDIEKLEDRLEQANITLRGDWSRWQKSMRSDLRAVFTQMAEKNVEYYEKVRNDPSQKCTQKDSHHPRQSWR